VLAICCLLLVTTAASAQNYADLILGSNPFAYFRFGEEPGAETVVDNGVGTGVDATYENVELGVPSLVEGETNTAVRFNGQDALIRVVDDPQINVTNGPWEDRSIEFWFSVDDASLDTPQVLFEEGGTTRGIAMYVLENNIYMGAWNRANDDAGVSSPWVNDEETPDGTLFVSREIDSGTAHHAAFVLDGDPSGFTGTITGYIDGLPFGSRTGAGQLFNHGDDTGIGAMDTNIWLADGTNPGGDGLYMAGVLDELAMYDYPLTIDQLLARVGDLSLDPPGDFNQDGVLDMEDYGVLTSNFNTRGGYTEGDMNFDGRIGLGDFTPFRQALAAAGENVAAVPEPSALLLGLAGLALAGLARQRRAARR
jgi:hypothetical protein